MNKWSSYFRCGFFTTFNVLANAFTLGRYLWLEGRVRGGTFRNWARRYFFTPVTFSQPTTEAEIVALVKSAQKLRVFGSAHSFNAGIQSDEVLLSLDRYSGVIAKDLAQKQMTFKGGTRVRDVTRALLDEGLAFAALPSHDAQSIAGIISTDVHGTGRDWGFVSEAVVKIKLIDGNGDIHECRPEDDLFKAAIGGIGAVGIITEVTVQAVDRFNVAQKFFMTKRSWAEENLEQLIAEHDHVSLYIFPFTDRCQVNTWNRTTAKQSFLGGLREFLAISTDALVGAWAGNFLAYSGLLPSLSTLAYAMVQGTDLVLESNAAFNRTIYPLHQELEFAIPFAESVPAWQKFIRLYEDLYPQGLPYTVFEVRFTPAGHDRTLIGPGRERRTTWIDLVCNDSAGFEIYYQAAEAEIKGMSARPHPGKYCETFDQADLAGRHPETFDLFTQLRQKHDPEAKFANAFTQRLFGD